MKFTLSWLKEHLETPATAAAIAERLTMIGLEVEGILDRAKGFENFTTARVVEAKPHPNADKLKLCVVDTGRETLQVVCGAPNARAGLIGVFAPAGSFIPGTGITLKKAAIRGVDSNGMLLSERELALSDEHEGIVDLPPSTPVGTPAAEALGLADPVIEVAITPNRGDCLGVRGIARDLAASGLGRFKPLVVEPVPGAFESPIRVHLDFTPATADACPYFVGRLIRGVKNGESPQWVRERLRAIGLRPISALVDITNLMTVEHARPLHVFDADKIKGHVHVRLSCAGERLMALNDKEYALDDAMTVIADEARPEALGGVIGGEASGCTDRTVNVFVESAYFDPSRTAATGRKLNVMTDARYRFERGVDPAFLRDGIELATRLILDFCGGSPSQVIVAGKEPAWRRSLTLRRERVMTLAGLDVAEAEIERILNALGFKTEKADGVLEVAVPSWRHDIVGEACLVEEVARIHGYDKIPSVPLARPTAVSSLALGPEQRRRATARRVLAGRGLVEAVTYSFLSSRHAALFGGVPDALKLVNPISSDLDAMRPSALPNLIAATGRNADRGVPDGALFEVGPQYGGDKPEDQATVAAGIRSGLFAGRSWALPARTVDVFDAKADALAVLAALEVPVDRLHASAPAPAWYHPGRSGVLSLGPKTALAYFGEIHPRVLKALDVKGPMVAFEVLLDALPKPKTKGAAKPLLKLPAFQPVERDFAFVVETGVTADAVVRAALAADKTLIVDARVFDLFESEGVGTGKKSLAIAVTLQPSERTLTDAEIEAVAEKIVASVAKATGGVLRA
jgi:phenylalanyl-tRNA synthetase beta chain